MDMEEIRFILPSKKNDIFAKHMIREGYAVFTFQQYDYTIFNAWYILAWKKCTKLAKRIYNRDLRKGYEGIYVVFDALVRIEDLQWLSEHNPKARMIYLIWNPVSTVRLKLTDVRNLGYEIWSYGSSQCREHGLKENLYFYCPSMYDKAKESLQNLSDKTEYDVIFAGKDKGRMDKINGWIKNNSLEHIKWNLYFTADHFWERKKKKEYRKSVDYEDIQLLQANAKAIMELLPAQDVDITMRTLDSLVLKRKLITDATDIKTREYYHPNNIFVMGVDAPEKIEEFLDAKYHEWPNEMIEKYHIHNWVKRFVEDKPINEYDSEAE